MHLSQAQAEGFYAVHKARPFFDDLVKFMTSGPCVVMASKARTPSPATASSWAPTDSKKAAAGHHPRRSTAPTSRRTPSTAATGPTPPRSSSASSSPGRPRLSARSDGAARQW